MLRQTLMQQEKKQPATPPLFRERGEEVSRLEGFSDAVFGFALTLVVVSLEVPRTFDDLLLILLGGGSFLVSFTLLVQIWLRHYRFFRRYGLTDSATITLNMLLLFLVLFYVYPLKFIFNIFINGIIVQLFKGSLSPEITDRLLPVKDITPAQTTLVYVFYGLGYIAIYCVFALLYHHAYNRRAVLELTAYETSETSAQVKGNMLMAGVGVLSILIALITHDSALPGIAYFAIGFVQYYMGATNGARRRQFSTEQTASH